EYISSRAEIYAHHVAPPQLTGIGGRIPWLPADNTEQQIDAREQYFSDPDVIAAYERAGMELPTEEEISSLPPGEEVYPQCPIPPRNEYRRAILNELTRSRKEDKDIEMQQEEDTPLATSDNSQEEEEEEEITADAPQQQPFEEMGLGCQVLAQSFFLENEHTVSDDLELYYSTKKKQDNEYIAQFLGNGAQESGNNFSGILS
ncbi:MAG: hypothetical protein JWQ38_3580, partial [Flavipsychrobacter sp.]|nr:hypothetical protein [Flavipsychrobacter sp.]